jgi:tRNA(His) 5'-end guanylyltransferase
MNNSLGDRMKDNYEKRYEYKLLRRTPVIIRLDGRSFHAITQGCERPFDNRISKLMEDTMLFLCKEIQGAKCAYTQSDEISILLTDYSFITTQAWFDYDLQKVISISAALASTYFSKQWNLKEWWQPIQFDSRAFNIPVDEVCNYFIWRQKDWIRNSVSMLAQAHFSPKQLLNKSQENMHDMLHEIGVNWTDLPLRFKNGVLTFKPKETEWVVKDNHIFTEDRFLMESLLNRED